MLKDAIPYPEAKPMYLVDNIDNKAKLKSVIIDTRKGISTKNNKKDDMNDKSKY